MKSLLLSLIFFTVEKYCFAQQAPVYHYVSLKTQLIKANKILKESVYSCTINNHQKIKDSTLIYQAQYDSMGNIFVEIFTSDFVSKRQIYFYNDLSKLVKIVSLSGDQTRLLHTQEFEYDSSGNNIAMYDYNADTTHVLIEKMEYVNNKKQTVYTQKNADSPYVSARYEYYPNGKTKKIETFNNVERPLSAYLFEYDTSKSKQYQYSILKSEKLLAYEYLVDASKRVLQKVSYRSLRVKTDFIIQTENYFYNELGLTSAVHYFANGDPSFQIHIYYE